MSDPVQFEGTTARMSLPLIFAAQAQKEFTVNEALLRIDIAMQCAVEDEVSLPPASPAIGQVWLIGTSPSGIFGGRAGEIAGWTADGWRFIAPAPGFAVYDRAAKCFRVFSGTWSKPVAPAAATGGATIDTEARAVIASLRQQLVSAGVLAPQLTGAKPSIEAPEQRSGGFFQSTGADGLIRRVFRATVDKQCPLAPKSHRR